MTDLTTVTIAGVSVNGDPLPAGRRVEIALIAGTAGGSVDGVAIVERWTVKLDAEGEGTIDLYPTSAIEPAGSYYAFTVDNTTPVIVRCITVPDSGPVSWVDEAIQVDNPSPPVTVPLPTSGDPLQVLRVNAEGNRYELTDLDDQTDLPAEIHAATGKTTPVDADEFPMSDSAASWGLKKLTWANLKATAKAYFDTLYMALVAGSNDDIMQRKSGAWTYRTLAQVKTDLAIAAWPSSHAILPAVQRPASYVTWTPAVSAVLAGGYASGANTVGSETWTYPVACRAGTWRADVVIRKTPASGIITATFGGSALGTADCYNATNSGDNNAALSTSFTIAADGTYDLVLTNPTKHASSTGCWWHIQVINLTRTGP